MSLTDAQIKKLIAGLRAVESLIAESHGVTGLHLNGSVAPWSELTTGGRYEEWLADFDEALQLIARESISNEASPEAHWVQE